MPSQVSSAGPSPEPPGFRWSWLVLAGTILAGCALGGAVMGVANVSGNGEPGTQARPTVAAADPGAGVEGDAAAVMRPAKPVSTSASPSPACRPLRTRGRSPSTWTAWWRPSLISSPSGCDRPLSDVQQVRNEIEDTADRCRALAAQRLQDAAEAEGEDAAPATSTS